jgi:hypothetical protein
MVLAKINRDSGGCGALTWLYAREHVVELKKIREREMAELEWQHRRFYVQLGTDVR